MESFLNNCYIKLYASLNIIMGKKSRRGIKKPKEMKTEVERREEMDTIKGKLTGLGLSKEIELGKLCQQQRTLRVSQDMKLDELLNRFIKVRSHMAIVENRQKEFVGVTTLEDVIEEVLELEIMDESDKIN